MDHLYFEREDEEKKENPKRGYIVVTADKGMAGAYNHNIIKIAEEELENIKTVNCTLSDRLEGIILPENMCRLIFISSIQRRTQVFTGRG